MACQEKDTESLKSLQTELWWVLEKLKFRHLMLVELHCHHFSILVLHIYYVLLFFPPSGHFWRLSRTTFSTWWFRSASRRLAKGFSTVQFLLLTSSGNNTSHNGTFLFLTGSVVRPEEVLLIKLQCCNLHSRQLHTIQDFVENWVLSVIILMWRCLSQL